MPRRSGFRALPEKLPEELTEELLDGLIDGLDGRVKGSKFSDIFTTPIIKVTVSKTKTFHLHSDLLTAESDLFSNSLKGSFKESHEKAIELEDEEPALFGFFVEYLYRNCAILSQEIQHYSDYVTLGRLYAMGERLQATKFQQYTLWRVGVGLDANTEISHESICELLRMACTELPERVPENHMRMYIFWYAALKIKHLRKCRAFQSLLREIPDARTQLCLWIDRERPAGPNMPNAHQRNRFAPESEYDV